jgi:DNA-binding transcriptional MerR regulator/methylmalonyl-CoA mutase cobalamin-binding subunit
MTSKEAFFSIGDVADRVGMSVHTLRAWEKRYTAIVPTRTDSNHRKYKQKDVDRATLLWQLTNAGHKINRIASLDEHELRTRLHIESDQPNDDSSRVLHAQEDRESMRAQSQSAIRQYDRELLEYVLSDNHRRLPMLGLLDDVIGPLLNWIGLEWHAGNLSVAQEHMASATIRDFLGRIRLLEEEPEDRPLIITATPSNHFHELGALMATNAAAERGWRTVYLGPNVPSQELADAAMSAGASAVALSIVYVEQERSALQNVDALLRTLPEEIKLIVGGAGVKPDKQVFEDIGVTTSDSFQDFLTILEA